jgi:predicted ATPase
MEESRAVVGGVLLPGSVSEAILSRILARADGNPLFLEELSRTALERGAGALAADVPATIEDVIAFRVGRLRPRQRQLLSAAAVIGREVPQRVLREVAGLPERALQDALAQLVRAGLLAPLEGGADAYYTFKHALVQEVSYARMPPSERRALHARILDTVEALPPGRLSEQVEWLAHHAIRGEAWDRAVRYLMQASLRAAARSAMAEAVEHVTTALELLARLPASIERDRDELRLQLALGSALRVTRGYGAPETGRAYTQARALWERVGDQSQLLPVLRGQWVHHLLRGEYRTARGFGDRMLAEAERHGEPVDLLEAHMGLGLPAVFLGEFVHARNHLETALGLYDPDRARSPFVLYGTDSRATCLAYLALALCALGHPDQATARGEEAVAHALARGVPLSVVQSMTVLANVHQMRRDLAAAASWSDRAIAFARERGFAYWMALGEIMQRWVEAERGDDAAIPRLREGLDRYRATGATLGWSWFLSLLAEAHARKGQAREGLAVVAEALLWVEQSDEAYWAAELHRLEGVLRLQDGGPDAAARAEASLVRSLDVARRQAARLWELRAATALGRLWQARDRRQPARELLAPILAGFVEGRETADVGEARALLETLGP